jgi:lactoylglutathione lyase
MEEARFMEFTFNHCNINVLDIERSVAFYKEALGLQERFRMPAPDGSFTIAFMGDGQTEQSLELTCLHDRKEPYELGDNESHIAFAVADLEGARKKHAGMGVICYENPGMGIYFIEDPDGYWMEIVPKR